MVEMLDDLYNYLVANLKNRLVTDGVIANSDNIEIEKGDASKYGNNKFVVAMEGFRENPENKTASFLINFYKEGSIEAYKWGDSVLSVIKSFAEYLNVDVFFIPPTDSTGSGIVFSFDQTIEKSQLDLS